MEPVIIAVLAAAVIALLLVLVRDRRRRSPTTATASSPVPEVLDARPVPGEGEGALEAYRVPEPASPGRELLVEFVPAGLSELADRAEFTRDSDGGHQVRNAIDGLVSTLPKAAALLEAGQTMRVVGPPEAIAGLANQSLKLVSSNGKTLGMAREVSSGQIANHLQFAQVQVSPAMAAMAIFQVMSVITGQYYLHRIDSKLIKIQSGIDDLQERLQAQTFSKLRAAASFNDDVRNALSDGRLPTETERQGLIHARSHAERAYIEAQDAVHGYIGRARRFSLKDAKRSTLNDLLDETGRVLSKDGQALVFAAFVLHQNRLLRLALETDPDSADRQRERIVKERAEMLNDLVALRRAIARLALLRENDLDERYVRFRSNDGEVEKINTSKKAFKTLQPMLQRDSDLLPEAPPVSPPFMAEVRRTPAGELEMASAVIEGTGEHRH